MKLKTINTCLLLMLGLVGCNELMLLSANASTLATGQPANTAPVAHPQSVGVSINSPPKSITLVGTDKDKNPLTYSIVTPPAHGTITQVLGAQWLYTRNLNYQGRDTFKFKVNDGTVDSKPAAVTIVNAPHGIMQLSGGTPWQTNPNVDGLHLGLNWSDVALTEDVSGWSWTILDQQLYYASTYHKQLGISLDMLSSPPSWLISTYGVPTYVIGKGTKTMTMVLPWDATVKQKMMDFITALAHHITSSTYGKLPVDGTAAYVVMGGLGISTETYMPGPDDTTPHIPDPNNPGQDISITDELALWQQTSKDLIASYAANFRSTPYFMAAGTPIQEDIPDSTVAVTDVFCDGAGATVPECAGTSYKGYGALFGVMSWALSSTSNTSNFIDEWISTNSPTHSTGFQFSSSFNGKKDPTAVLNAGLSLNAHFMEVYAADADGLFGTLIHTYSALLPY